MFKEYELLKDGIGITSAIFMTALHKSPRSYAEDTARTSGASCMSNVFLSTVCAKCTR